MVRTSLGSWKIIPDLGRLSHLMLIIASSLERNGDDLGMSFHSPLN